MRLNVRRALLAATAALAVGGAVMAQGLSSLPASGAPPQVETPSYAMHGPLADSDAQTLLSALAGAQAGDPGRIRAAMQSLSDPLARKIALWALVDTAPEGMSYAELDGARRDLAGSSAHRQRWFRP